jgi:eukaryotic-like serine/threonine-protein kinase
MLREAKVLASLEHPGIVLVHDVGATADGRLFYAMKLVRGSGLERAVTGKGLHELLQLYIRICEPVAFAHARGIIHRDLKPMNIMVGPFGEVLVMDWGIAKILAYGEPPTALDDPHAPASQAPGHTTPGTVLGTPGYMSPEQARGDSAAVDIRTDVYALGAVLRFLLAKSQSSGYHAARLGAISRKAMSADPAGRYPSVTALMDEITRFVEGLPIEAYPEHLARRIERVLRRYRLPVALVLAYMVMRVVVALLSR